MKKVLIFFLALCLMFGLSGCGASLPDSFEEESVLNAAKATVEKINALDYEGVTGELREDLKEAITSQQLEEAWGARLEELGEFEEIRDSALKGTKDQSTGEEYAVVVLACAYENGTAIYTLSYDQDLALVGLYMK